MGDLYDDGDVVAKGGNFLLNIGVSPEGEFAPDAYARLRDIGEWMKINGEAIYGTKPFAPYKQDKLAFTSRPDGTVFAVYLADENETLPQTLLLKGIAPAANAKAFLLGSPAKLEWQRTPDGSRIVFPADADKSFRGRFALVVKLTQVETR